MDNDIPFQRVFHYNALPLQAKYVLITQFDSNLHETLLHSANLAIKLQNLIAVKLNDRAY